MPLIVVHGHDTVEFPSASPYKQRVARDRPAGVNLKRPCCLHGWLDDSHFLIAEQAAVAGMRIEGRHADPWPAAEQATHDVVQ